MAGKRLPFPGLTRAIAGLAVWSSRNAGVALVLILVITGGLGYGMTKLTTNVDVADVLPEGDFNTTAAKRLTVDFKSAFTQQVTLQFNVDSVDTNYARWNADNNRLLPNRQSAVKPHNITDEVYVRAIAQFTAFFLAETDFEHAVSSAELYKLLNWTVAGGQNASDDAWSLPNPSDYNRNLAGESALIEAIDALSSPNWTTTALLIMPPSDSDLDLAELGRQALEARDNYLEWARGNPNAYQVFTGDNKPVFTVELPIANAHSGELVKEDFSRLLPIIGLFILVVLFLAFRNIGSMLIAFFSLSISVAWTYGMEGYMGIALNPLNLTLMPLIMGVGIDYSIHIINEFLEHKSHGSRNVQAFAEVGRRAGLALFVATAITVAGLAVMAMSPSVLIVEFGYLAAFSIASTFFVSIIFIPAALTLYPWTNRMGQSFRPSGLMAVFARGITKVRYLSLLLVIVGSGLGASAAAGIHFESFGDPGRNYLETDPLRQEHELGLQRFYDTNNPNIKANVIAFVGDVTTPESHAYMRAIESALRSPPPHQRNLVIGDTLRTIPFLMETWLRVKDGVSSVGLSTLADQQVGGDRYPTTRAAIRTEFDALYNSPVATLGSIFTNGPNKNYDLGVMTFSVRAGTFEEAANVWEAVWDAVEVADSQVGRPQGLEVAFVGNTATNYLFVEREVPWLNYMGAASTGILVLVAAAFFRSWRAVATVALVSFATVSIWIGILPEFGIGLAITLVLPLIFIISLGSDYTIHLLWSMRIVGDAREVFRTVGKAILFSFVTTVGPFLIFTEIQDLSVRKTMLATAMAIFFVFLITMLVVPAMYKVEGAKKARPPGLLPTEARRPEAEDEPPLVAVKRPKPTG